MTISITAKPLTVKVEIGDYGLFTVRLMGASTESEIRRRLREAKEEGDKVLDKYKSILDRERELIDNKNEDELQSLRVTPEYKQSKKELDAIVEKMDSANLYAEAKRKELFSSENEGAVEKLFDELTNSQIRDIYNEIVARAEELSEEDNG